MFKIFLCTTILSVFGCSKVVVEPKVFEECYEKCKNNQGIKEVYDGLYYQCACNNDAHFPLENRIKQ